MPDVAHLQVDMHKFTGEFGNFGPGSVSYLQNREMKGDTSSNLLLSNHLTAQTNSGVLTARTNSGVSSCRAQLVISLCISAIQTIGSLKSKANLSSHKVLLNMVWPPECVEAYEDLKIREEIWHSVKTDISKDLSR